MNPFQDTSYITPYNWWNYRNNFSPPLVGPSDIRVFKQKNKIFVTDYMSLIGIQRILKKEKHLRQSIEINDSILKIVDNGPQRHPHLARMLEETKEELGIIRSQIAKLIV